jgi:hypothetical protein
MFERPFNMERMKRKRENNDNDSDKSISSIVRFDQTREQKNNNMENNKKNIETIHGRNENNQRIFNTSKKKYKKMENNIIKLHKDIIGIIFTFINKEENINFSLISKLFRSAFESSQVSIIYKIKQLYKELKFDNEDYFQEVINLELRSFFNSQQNNLILQRKNFEYQNFIKKTAIPLELFELDNLLDKNDGIKLGKILQEVTLLKYSEIIEKRETLFILEIQETILFIKIHTDTSGEAFNIHFNDYELEFQYFHNGFGFAFVTNQNYDTQLKKIFKIDDVQKIKIIILHLLYILLGRVFDYLVGDHFWIEFKNFFVFHSCPD